MAFWDIAIHFVSIAFFVLAVSGLLIGIMGTFGYSPFVKLRPKIKYFWYRVFHFDLVLISFLPVWNRILQVFSNRPISMENMMVSVVIVLTAFVFGFLLLIGKVDSNKYEFVPDSRKRQIFVGVWLFVIALSSLSTNSFYLSNNEVIERFSEGVRMTSFVLGMIYLSVYGDKGKLGTESG